MELSIELTKVKPFLIASNYLHLIGIVYFWEQNYPR